MLFLLKYAQKLVLPQPEKLADQLTRLRLLLIDANQKVNLTRLTGELDFEIKHAIDSLAIAEYFPEIKTEKLTIADIGCGAGFPSLVLAAAFPNLQICAIDSTGKKIKFVESAAKMLALNNLRAIHGRSNELNLKRDFQFKFDIVTARAVAPAPLIVAESDNFLRAGGKYIFYKTLDQAREDLPILTKMGGSWRQTPEFVLPENMGSRCFIAGSPKLR